MPFSLSDDDKQRLVAAIAAAETGSRGELRLHLDKASPEDALRRAEQLFHQLGMSQTRDGTGVLLYVAPIARKVAVYAGPGIHQTAGQALWQSAVRTVADGFRNDDPLSGLESAIHTIGEALRRCAPGEDAAGNELSNEVTIS